MKTILSVKDVSSIDNSLSANDSNAYTSKENVEFFLNKIEKLRISFLNARNQLEEIHKYHHKIVNILHKELKSIYGVPIENTQNNIDSSLKLKNTVSPLHRGLIRAFKNSDVHELELFFNQNSLVEELFFSDFVVFDEKVEDIVQICPPNLRVSFFSSLFDKVWWCNMYFKKTITVLEQFSSADILINCLSYRNDAEKANYSQYTSFLSTISCLFNSDECVILYITPDGNSLVYPLSDSLNSIPTSNTLVGYFLFEKKPSTIIHPEQHSKYDISKEGSLFRFKKSVISIPFKTNNVSQAGIILLFRNSEYRHSDLIMINGLVPFFEPIISLFRANLLQSSPKDFISITESISKLRDCSDIMTSFIGELCSVTSSTFCRILLSEEDTRFPDLEVLSNEKSLIRNAFENGGVFSCTYPRMRNDFNKRVDDHYSLPKITSLLIVPVIGSSFIIVLYNSIISTEFTPIQISITKLFGRSLTSLLDHLVLKNGLLEQQQNNTESNQSIRKSYDLLHPIIESSIKGNVFQKVSEILPQDVHFDMFHINEDCAICYPEIKECKLQRKLLDLNNSVLWMNEENDICGFENMKSLLIYPYSNPMKVIIVFSSPYVDYFLKDQDFYQRISITMNFLFPLVILKNGIFNNFKKFKSIREILFLSFESLRSFLGYNIEIKHFEKPLTELPPFEANEVYPIMKDHLYYSIIICKDQSIKENHRRVIKLFAEALCLRLNEKEKINNMTVFVNSLISKRITEVLKCTEKCIETWAERMSQVFISNGIDLGIRCDGVEMSYQILNGNTWIQWFSEIERSVIILLAALDGISKAWKICANEKIMNIVENSRLPSCPYIAALLGDDIGIPTSMNDFQKKEIAQIISDFAIDESITEEVNVLSHVRSISIQSFKTATIKRRWIARAIIMITRMAVFLKEPQIAAEDLLASHGENGRKREIFKAERVYIPLLTFMLHKNDYLSQVSNTIRNNLRLTRNFVK